MRWLLSGKIKSKELKKRRAEILELLFLNRGLKTLKQQKEFLKPIDPDKLSPSKLGLKSRELKKAVARLKKAIKNKEKIIVYGDFDADGICATGILWEALDKLGAKVMPYLPTREEGYGLKVSRLEKMCQQGVRLVVTVDNGIVHNREVESAQKMGLDVIITDHHEPGKKLPPARAVVHTTKLAGVGVAWFLAKALGAKPDLDLVSIGTITDLVPLLGGSRSLVKFGLKRLGQTKRPGLLALYDFIGLNRDYMRPYEVGYLIGPRLNAAGRMDDPMESLRLICTRDENRAISLAQNLDQKNRERQKLLEKTFLHAREKWLKEDGQSPLIFVAHRSYQEGIVGLVASRLCEEFYRPAVVVALGKDIAKGSARSIEEFNIVLAVRQQASLLSSHGGHPRAAGFSVKTKKVKSLKKNLIGEAKEKLGDKELAPVLKVEAEVGFQDLNLKLFRKIEKLAPFGMENPRPVLVLKSVWVKDARLVGAEKRHLKLVVGPKDSRYNFNAIGFGLGHFFPKLSAQKPVGLAFSLLLDEWEGRERLQLKIKDIKL